MSGRHVSGCSLAEAGRRFQQWRRDRMFPGRIPHELWRLAAAAAAVHGVELTADRLRVDLGRLKKWMGNAEGAGQAAGPDTPPQFVELPPLNVGGGGECTLELEEPSGRKSRIVLRGEALTRVVELGQMLWRSSP